MSVTIKDVATKAGVSPITASRTFSGSHTVAEETRRRVLAAADELGYAPDLLARGLVHRRVPVVGLLVTELSNPFFVPIIDAVQAVCQQREYLLVTSQSERRLQTEEICLHQFRQMRVAGVLVVPISVNRDHLLRLQAEGIPTVAVARVWQEGEYVTVDDRAGGHLAGAHLVRLGHKRIGSVALDEPGHTGIQARLQGFADAIQEHGAVLDPAAVILTETLHLEDGMRAADTFLTLPRRPTAMFVASDRLAIGFMRRLCQLGVAIPDDVAVVGYDDIPHADFLQIPLTSVALPKYEMGKQAAELIFERIANERPASELRQILLPPRLVVRASCGAARIP